MWIGVTRSYQHTTEDHLVVVLIITVTMLTAGFFFADFALNWGRKHRDLSLQ